MPALKSKITVVQVQFNLRNEIKKKEEEEEATTNQGEKNRDRECTSR